MTPLCKGILATVHLDSDTPGARKSGVFEVREDSNAALDDAIGGLFNG